jgi:hypothetical protein
VDLLDDPMPSSYTTQYDYESDSDLEDTPLSPVVTTIDTPRSTASPSDISHVLTDMGEASRDTKPESNQRFASI